VLGNGIGPPRGPNLLLLVSCFGTWAAANEQQYLASSCHGPARRVQPLYRSKIRLRLVVGLGGLVPIVRLYGPQPLARPLCRLALAASRPAFGGDSAQIQVPNAAAFTLRTTSAFPPSFVLSVAVESLRSSQPVVTQRRITATFSPHGGLPSCPGKTVAERRLGCVRRWCLSALGMAPLAIVRVQRGLPPCVCEWEYQLCPAAVPLASPRLPFLPSHAGSKRTLYAAFGRCPGSDQRLAEW